MCRDEPAFHCSRFEIAPENILKILIRSSGFSGIVFMLAGRRALLASGNFLHIVEEPLRVTRIKVVVSGFKGRFIGPVQSQDARPAHCPQLPDNCGFIFRWNGVPHYHQIKFSFFTGANGSGDAYHRFNFKSFTGEQQLPGLQ